MNIVQVPALKSNYGNKRIYPVKKIVLHWMNGTLAGTDSWFKNPAAKASAHYGIGSMGAIHQYVQEDWVAWHAGPGVNFESIGIENEGGPAKPSQLCHDACAMLVADICKRYHLPCDRNTVRKHNEYMNTQCLPIGTQVLTPSGWKQIEDVTKEDVVAEYRDDKTIDFVNPVGITEPYSSKVYNMKVFTSTPNHRIVHIQSNGKEVVHTLEELKNRVNFTIPTTGNINAEGLSISNELLQLLVFVQADGSYVYTEKNKVESIIFHLKKERKIELLKKLLTALNKKYSFYQKGDGSYNLTIYEQEWIKENVLRYLPEKQFIWEFLKLSPSQAKLFLDTIVLADGHTDADGSNAYYSNTNKQSVDIVQGVAHLNGKSTILTKHISKNPNHKESYRLGLREVNVRTIYNQNLKEERSIVACIEVPSGKILARQGQYVFVTGNCPGSLDVDYIISKANSIINGTPMTQFDYELYLAGNDMYMRVLAGSINEKITVTNKDTGWVGTPYCNKSPNNDGGPINTDVGKNLYEVNARGIVKQLDNRIVNPPTDKCPVQLAAKEEEVKSLNVALAESKAREVALTQSIESSILEHHKQIEELTAKQITLVEMLADKDKTIQQLRTALAKTWVDNFVDWLKNIFNKKP